MFLQALQFQQQQAALQQAQAYGTQFGFAPSGNWMTWGAGGPTQPPAGTPTQQQQLAQMQLGQGALANALSMAGVTGQFAQPLPSQYAAGTVLTSPSQQPGMGPAYGIVQQDGSVQMATTEQLDAVARQRGTTAQAMMQSAAPVDWQTLQRLSMGPPTGPTQQTQAALQQQYAQALASGNLTGMFYDPSQTPDALLQQGKAMNGASFNDLPPDQQQYWLQYNQNNPTQAAQQWARGVNGALQQQGYQNPAAGGQQTLPAQLQQAQLSGMYQGAPTETAREFNVAQAQQYNEFLKNLALQQGQLGQQYLSTAAQLSGPQNTFQLSNYLRGAQGNPNVPVYLQNLAGNMGMPAFQGTGSTAPTPLSMGGLAAGMGYTGQPSAAGNENPSWQQGGYTQTGRAAIGNASVPEMALQGGDVIGGQMQNPTWQTAAYGAAPAKATYPGGPVPQTIQAGNLGPSFDTGSTAPNTSIWNMAGSQPATSGWDYGSTLNAIRGIAQRGAQGLAPGSLESMSPDELQAFGSGLGAAGYTLPSFLQQYQRSRIGQQAPTFQTSLA